MALSETEQEIFDYLKAKALEPTGLAPVQSAIKRFLAKGLKAISEPTEREQPQATYKRWAQELWQKQGGRCGRCRNSLAKDEATFDHIKSVVLGGADTKQNGRAVHGTCNSRKGGRSLIQESRATGQSLKEILEG